MRPSGLLVRMTKRYHFWITGCQMNYADARRVATELEKLGYRSTPRAEDADVVILETCTVRQQSEDKAYHKLHSLKPLKARRPDMTVAVMGCVVGVRATRCWKSVSRSSMSSWSLRPMVCRLSDT